MMATGVAVATDSRTARSCAPSTCPTTALTASEGDLAPLCGRHLPRRHRAQVRRHRHLGPHDVSILYMSWSKDGPGDRDAPRGYHHGNLREALIRAALELIARKGTAGLTSRRLRALPASARRRRIDISATAMS